MKSKKLLATLLALIFILCLIPAYALADEKPSEITNDEGSTIYNAGDTVFNNGGIVYNNSGIVYNNGGVVYNNGGTAYNNAGIVYNNGGEVFNNDGTVYNNSGVVHDNGGIVKTDDEKDVTEADSTGPVTEDGRFTLETAGDYGVYADIAGLNAEEESGTLFIDKDSVCTISPKEGFIIAEASSTAGKITDNEDGTYTLSDADADVLLTLVFKPVAPIFSYDSGTYGDALTVELSAVSGADIYYTLNGDVPTAESTLYESTIEIEQGTVVNAIAIFDGAESDAAVAAYAIPTVTAPEFDVVKLGYKQPKAQGIIVENAGDADAVITGVELSGDSVDSFVLSTADGATVKAGETDDATWTLQPVKDLKNGVYSVKVKMSYDSGDFAELYVGFKVTE